MPHDAKVNTYATLIGLIIGALFGVAVFYILPLAGSDASDRRPIAVFGEDVAHTLSPMLDETRTEPLTATDAKAIASLKQTYDALTRNKSIWSDDVTPPDAPFFKTLAQYDAEKMSAFKQTTLLASARRDVNQFVDETKAFHQSSAVGTTVVRTVMGIIVGLVLSFLSGIFVHEHLSDRYARQYYENRNGCTSSH